MNIYNSLIFRFISILMIFLSHDHSYVYGQDSYIKGRWNIKAGYSRYGALSWSDGIERMTGHYRLEANYGFLNAIETGIYFGYSIVDIYPLEPKSYIAAPSSYYGLNLNVHPLDWLFDLSAPRFDIYVTGRYGFRYYHESYHEYGIGGGLAWYWGRYFGVYMEYTYGNHGAFWIYDNHMKFRYGISIRF